MSEGTHGNLGHIGQSTACGGYRGKLPIKSEMWVSKDTGIDFKAYMNLMKALGMEKLLGKIAEYVESI